MLVFACGFIRLPRRSVCTRSLFGGRRESSRTRSSRVRGGALERRTRLRPLSARDRQPRRRHFLTTALAAFTFQLEPVIDVMDAVAIELRPWHGASRSTRRPGRRCNATLERRGTPVTAAVPRRERESLQCPRAPLPGAGVPATPPACCLSTCLRKRAQHRMAVVWRRSHPLPAAERKQPLVSVRDRPHAVCVSRRVATRLQVARNDARRAAVPGMPVSALTAEGPVPRASRWWSVTGIEPAFSARESICQVPVRTDVNHDGPSRGGQIVCDQPGRIRMRDGRAIAGLAAGVGA